MIDAILWRLIWKEYRLQRAFFAAIVVLALAVQVLGLLGAVYQGVELPVEWVYLIAAGSVALYALGCGATLFATEHESGTFDFQRSLPVSAARFFVGKLAFAIGSTLLLSMLVWIVTVAVSKGVMPPAGRHLEIACAGAVAALEMLAWSVFFSLVLRQPLLAAILGVATASILVQTVVPSFTGYQYGNLGFRHYLELLPQRCLLGMTILVLDAAIGFRWFHGTLWHRKGRMRILSETSPSRASVFAGYPLALNGRALGVLVWQTWKQGNRLLITCTALYLFLVALPWIYGAIEGRRVSSSMRANGIESFVWLVPLAALFGCGTFLLDQTRHRFRFFAERGTKPRLVWASRHIVWAGVLTLLTVAACIYTTIFVVARGELSSALEVSGELARLALALLSTIVVSYAAAQTCAMFLCSPILAVTFGLASATALCGWVGLMTAARVPWLWSVAPIPLILLFATWLRTPGWVLERSSLRARTQAVVSLVVPLGAIVAGVIAYRVDEIPAQGPGFSLAEFDRPLTAAEEEASELYFTAFLKLVPFEWPEKKPSEPDEAEETASSETPPAARPLDFSGPDRALFEEEERWVIANETVIDRLLDATRRKSAVFFDPHANRRYVATSTGQTICSLLLASAKYDQAQGELDAAWERYRAILRMTRHARHRGEWSEHYLADGFEQM
ncbi:MAG: ABC transporter permease, partial [Pirellulaceae bacterium]